MTGDPLDRRQLLKISAYSSLLAGLGACAQVNSFNAVESSNGLPAWPIQVQKIIFGSCIDQKKPQPIWQTILAAKPDLFIFGGDNVYASNQPWQLQNLKNQLNPHFLFNNLSVLTSLVYKNQDKAADFINELAKVYRYVLDTKNSELVPLQEELDFINHYIFLQKIRFEDSISFEIKIEESKKSDYLLPMCLQMLVENTIQHNETSQANPLKVLIYTDNDSLVIENPILSRSHISESTKTGIKNIKQRYSFFTDKKVIVSNNGKVFKVILPLIQKKWRL